MDDPQPTSMVDIYEAAGGTTNEDRTQVSVNPPLKAFDIQLRVTPIGWEKSIDAGELVTFAVLLHDEYVGTRFVVHETELTLPVRQVRIVKEGLL